jgi:hypothetical protein
MNMNRDRLWFDGRFPEVTACAVMELVKRETIGWHYTIAIEVRVILLQ